MQLDVVLPAGGLISGEFAERAGTSVKAFIKFNGESILSRTVYCLKQAGVQGRYVIVGPEEVASDESAGKVDAVVVQTATGPENILAGLEKLREMGSGGRIVIANTDLPLLSPESVKHFVEACPDNIDICAPALTKQMFEAKYPGLRAAFVPLSDGDWTMGCLFLVNANAIAANRAHIARVFEARKSQMQMAGMLGWRFVLKFLTHRLALKDIERRCCRILGCSAAAIITDDADLAFDLDELKDYEYALRQFGQ